MKRLIHNRAFIGILLMALQLAFLPNVSRCAGARLVGSSCCCTANTSGPAEEAHQDQSHSDSQQGCCSKRACCSKSGESRDAPPNGVPDGPDDVDTPDGSRNGICSCFHGSDYPACPTEKTERDNSQKKHAGALLPIGAHCKGSPRVRGIRLRGKPIPRVRPGPPLQVLYQVFLI